MSSLGAHSKRVLGTKAATSQPSPLAGEGGAIAPGEGEATRSKPHRSAHPKRVLGTKVATSQPSPLAGEGGATAPGEGEATSTKPSGNPMRDTARKLRRTMTDAERKLWGLLRNRRLTGYKFRRQVPVGPYVADFLSYSARLIVEADGSQHAAATRDATRDTWLESQGYRILRFWNSDIFANPEGVLTRIIETAPASIRTSTVS